MCRHHEIPGRPRVGTAEQLLRIVESQRSTWSPDNWKIIRVSEKSARDHLFEQQRREEGETSSDIFLFFSLSFLYLSWDTDDDF